MNRKALLRVCLASFLIFSHSVPLAHAEENEVQLLRKEVRELKKTVNQLTDLVEKQNQRIDQLAQTKSTPESTVSTSPSASNGNQEVESLLNTVNNAPPLPGSQTKSVGLWKYPTPPSAAAKILPDISVIGSFAGSYFSQEPMGEVGVDPNRTGFTFQELELGFQGAVDPYFRYDAFLSFTEEGVEIEEAYFTTFGGLPRGLQFLGGKKRLPFGRQNPKHLHAWSFADNTLVNKYLLGPDGLKEVGLELAYLFPLPFFMQFQGTFTNGDGDTSFGGEGKGEFLYQGRLSSGFDIGEDLSMLLGASGAFGFNNTTPGNHTSLYGVDMFLKWKPSAYQSLSWQTEYILRSEQFPGGTVEDGGLYSYVDYQFLKQFHVGLRYDQMGLPVGVLDSEWRLTPAFTFNPTEFSQIRLQYEYDKIANLPGSQAVILQLMFSLGAHGAHLY